jgi:predicted nucleotidyltransferase
MSDNFSQSAASASDQLTPYPAINTMLERLQVKVRNILGDQFIGLYLYGSLAIGDFDPQKSDIDFVVVTAGELSSGTVAELKAMHEDLVAEASKWGAELEGSYISRQALRRYNPEHIWHPHIDRGNSGLVIERHDTDWIVQRFVLREHGRVISGPDPRTLIDPISATDLRRAVLGFLWWWQQQLEDTQRVARSDYQAYAVLTMCRVLYTLKNGDVLSKPAAAHWALSHLDRRWSPLIQRAQTWHPEMEMDRLEETLDFIRYTLHRSREFEF